MPEFGKSVLSRHLRTRCGRQLFLDLHPRKTCGEDRDKLALPDPTPPAQGVDNIKEAGVDWEKANVTALVSAFGIERVLGRSEQDGSGWTFHAEALDGDNMLPEALGNVPVFIAQARFSVGPTFASAVGLDVLQREFNLRVQDVVPDLLEVLRPLDGASMATPEGRIVPLPLGDRRRRLRVIDIKMNADPNFGHHAEVAYYTMVLAGWLADCAASTDQRLRYIGQNYVAAADPVIWAGSHEASPFTRARRAAAKAKEEAHAELAKALESEFQVMPFEVFASTIRRFFSGRLTEVLMARENWEGLSWHVDGLCRVCEYLGAPGGDAGHCLPASVNSDHLSRVPFLSRGACRALAQGGITTVAALSEVDFDSPQGRDLLKAHRGLRTHRGLIVPRAAALATGAMPAVAGEGGSALMPRWADLKIFVVAAFDSSSHITGAFGVSASWYPGGDPADRNRWPHQTFCVDAMDTEIERDAFVAFLDRISEIMKDARHRAGIAQVTGSHQVYIWDSATHKHLSRVAARHLDAVTGRPDAANFSWLLPLDSAVANVDGLHVFPTALTVVQEAVRSTLVLDIPHQYSLLDVARVYHPAGLPEKIAAFEVHPAFVNTLGDHIPPERIHEIWSRSTKPSWSRRLADFERTLGVHLSALDAVVQRLETDLRGRLTAVAPTMPAPGRRRAEGNPDSALWLAYSSFNVALERAEVAKIRAMPLYEREARGKSAHLLERLAGNERGQAVEQLQIDPDAAVLVYRLAAGSREVSLRAGDIGWALAPSAQPGLLDRSLRAIATQCQMTLEAGWGRFRRMEDACACRVVAIDRNALLIALKPSRPELLAALEQHGAVDLLRDAVLDPVHLDLFHAKLASVLKSIGTPDSYIRGPLVQRRGSSLPPSRVSPASPVADLLWATKGMQATTSLRNPAILLEQLAAHGVGLNASQRDAVVRSLTRRVHLIWGPPGTGKSHTLLAVLLSAMIDAAMNGRRLRVLVTAFTWAAIDNVLRPLWKEITKQGVGADVAFHRVRSSFGSCPDDLDDIDFIMGYGDDADDIRTLRRTLAPNTQYNGQNHGNITVVGTTAHQVANIVVPRDEREKGNAVSGMFDLVVIDEGSQMDVNTAIVALSGLADGGTVICAGDLLQLAPIHKAEPPEGLENMVGSIYGFLKWRGVEETLLEVNYRSNSTIVDLCRQAGYGPNLTAWSPNLHLRLDSAFPDGRPSDWPATLPWSPHWAEMLDPSRPLSAFVHPDGRSAQSDEFEAQVTAAMVVLLWRHMAAGPGDERDHSGRLKPTIAGRYTPQQFWVRGVGVVCPHRAQQALVISHLEAAFRNDPSHPPELIRAAVDTVERFQGQQRDVIIATYAMGDPDTIAGEEAFLLSLNRFNVMVSRAVTKLVVLMSQEIVDHLPSDPAVMRDSMLLKTFAESACPPRQQAALPWIDDGAIRMVEGTLHWSADGRATEVVVAPPPAPPASTRAAAPLSAVDALGSDILATIRKR